MISSPLVVGDPGSIGLSVIREMASVSTGGTLAWDVTADLRDAVDVIAPLGWDALLVDAANEGLSTAAMSHLAQIHGVPAALVVCTDASDLLQQTLDVATMAARHLPAVPVILTGDLAAEAAVLWAPVAEGLELAVEIIPLAELCAALSNDNSRQSSERNA